MVRVSQNVSHGFVNHYSDPYGGSFVCFFVLIFYPESSFTAVDSLAVVQRLVLSLSLNRYDFTGHRCVGRPEFYPYSGTHSRKTQEYIRVLHAEMFAK